MPNWCTNSLSIVAESEQELQEFLEKVRWEDEEGKKVDFSFNSLVPRPEGVDWYEWNVNNWGTKWDVGECYITIEKENAYISFDTAWSPPIEWLQVVAPIFPNLTFELKYIESGMGFAGKLTIEGNCIFEDISVGTDDDLYWDIVTQGMSEEEIEERALETIKHNSLDYWEYTKDEFISYVGENHRFIVENLIIANKVAGKMPNSTEDCLCGSDLEEVVKETIGVDEFYKNIFAKKKSEGTLKRFAN